MPCCILSRYMDCCLESSLFTLCSGYLPTTVCFCISAFCLLSLQHDKMCSWKCLYQSGWQSCCNKVLSSEAQHSRLFLGYITVQCGGWAGSLPPGARRLPHLMALSPPRVRGLYWIPCAQPAGGGRERVQGIPRTSHTSPNMASSASSHIPLVRHS